MEQNTTPLRISHFLSAALLLACGTNAQTIFLEEFDGGVSTTGFVVDQTNVTDCRWEFAPDSAGGFDFSVDGAGEWPAGPGFDSSFVFLDSDACGGTSVVVNSLVTSAPFDASAPGGKLLSFAHQFQARLESFIRVEAYNGNTWTEVYYHTGTSVGYPNPTALESINITDAVGASPVAQIRFQFSAGWDWWWAVDSIEVKSVTCIYPNGLAISNITTDGGTVSWTDNGSAGYEWVITTGALPDGSNAVASGTGANPLATGLASGTGYTVYVRSTCGGESSDWSSGVPFSTLITNDGCETAAPVTVNGDDLCGSVTSGTVVGATASGVTTTCSGTADDDVWFSFTANSTSQVVSLIDITGSTSDMYFAVWSGTCAAPELVPNSCSDPQTATINGLVAGQPYLLQVYTWTGTPDQTSAFNVCIGASVIGIDELNASAAIDVYPNPVSDVLNLRNMSGAAVNVSIIDVLGHMVAQHPAARSISVESLATGTYTLVTTDLKGRSLARGRFVKE
jgi:Secretion system C-terminal sorting domain